MRFTPLAVAGLFHSVVGLLVFAGAAPAAAQPTERFTIRVQSQPSGATVEVLGIGELGRTPLRRALVPAGEQIFVFSRSGYGEERLVVDVARDGQLVEGVLTRAAQVQVRADNLAARGAEIRVDGQPVGEVPATVEVAAGRRLIEVEAEDHLVFSTWLEVSAGGRETLEVRLEPRPPEGGAILVTSDVANAEVRVGGESVGQVPRLIEGLEPGSHEVEVRAPDGRVARRTIDVRANARETLHVELVNATPPGATIRVESQPTGAAVMVDGTSRGVTPLLLDDQRPGSHWIELSLEGYEPERRVITLEAGGAAEVSVTLSRGAPRPGRVVVTADRDDAYVRLAGLSRGLAPITLERIPPGSHVVQVVAAGAPNFEAQCTITYGETCTVEAVFAPTPIDVRVEADVEGAMLTLGDEPPRELPWQGELPPGEYELRVEAEGYEGYEERLVLAAGEGPRGISASLAPLEIAEPEPEEGAPVGRADGDCECPPRSDRFIPLHGAEPVAEGGGIFAFGTGFPFIGRVAGQVGLPGPLDVGASLRTFGRLTELEVQGRVGIAPVDALAFGAVLGLGLGFGPGPSNTFTARLDGRMTLFPMPELAITAIVGLDLSSDDYPFAEEDEGLRLEDRGRQDLARGRLGGAVDVRVAPGWSVGGRVEGIFASSGAGRRALGDVFGTGIGDPAVYVDFMVQHQW